jgi:hypothetical protein
MNVLFILLLVIYDAKIVKTSVYNPVKAQCDSSPKETASGVIINTGKLRKGIIRYISLSRDLLKKHKYGSYLIIKCNNTYYNGKWMVVDTMNKRFKNKIDFLQHKQNKNKPPRKVIIQWIKN